MLRYGIFFTTLVLLCIGFAQEARGQVLGDPKGVQQTQPPPPPPPPPRPVETLPPDVGRLDGSRYVSDFFGFSVEVPKDWVLLDTFTRDELKRRSKDLAKVEDAEKQRQINASVERTTILLSVSKLPLGSTQSFNAVFSLIAERMPSAIVKNGTDVLRSMERVFKDTNMEVEFQGAIRETKIGGADFATATTKVTVPSGVFMQKYYITVRKSYALTFTYTYVDESDLAAIDEIMKTVKFN